MASFEMQGPDGKTYEVEAPDMQAAVSALQGMTQPKYDEAAAKDRMYEGRARAMRKASPTMTGVRDTVQRFVEGTPIGSFFDEAMAGVTSMLPQSMGGQSYADAKGLLDADRRIRDEESTKLATLPIIGDVTVGGVNKLAGAVASAPLAPVARVFQGGTLWPTMGNVAISGAGYGGLYGAGEGNAAYERAGNAALGTGIGLGVGAVAAPVAHGIGNAVGAVRNRMMELPQQLAGRSRSAVNRVIDAADMDGLTPGMAGQNARLLGREGMLADAGENLTTVTEGLAQQPGPARDTINRALQGRAAGAPQRITQALDDNIGPPVNVPASVDQMRQQANQQARPLYQQFYQTQVPVDQELVSILQAVPDNVWPRVQSLMRAERIDPATPINTGQGIDLIKRALDDAARSAGRGTNEERVFANLARSLRNHVDNLLSPGNPAASPWAQARAIVGEERGINEALQEGQGVFRGGGRAPEQVAADMQGMSQLESEAFGLGARSELRNMMGRAATNFGPSGDRVARRALNSDFNRQNIEQIAGQQPAARIADRIDAENTFAETANQVMGNSATARRQATRDMIPRQYDAASMKELRGTSLSGLAMEGVGRILNMMTAGALNARNRAIAQDMAEMLIAQGADRNEIVRGLMTYARQIQGNAQQRAEIARVARDILRSTAQPAISARTAD